MSSPTSNITSVLKESRLFPPPAEFAAGAHIKSQADYEKLWQRAADDPTHQIDQRAHDASDSRLSEPGAARASRRRGSRP